MGYIPSPILDPLGSPHYLLLLIQMLSRAPGKRPVFFCDHTLQTAFQATRATCTAERPRTRPPSNVTAVLALHEDTFIRVFSQCEHTWLCLYLRSLLTLWESLVSSWWPRGLLLPPEVALRVALYLAVRL